MSYDLNFYKQTTDSISKSDIEAYLNQLPNVTNENGIQWIYHNEDTGSYCSFEYHELDKNYEEIEVEYFEGFDDTNFTFNINFIRPQFFGKECFPVVDKFVEDLHLFILNPQRDGVPQKYEKGILEQQWGASNLKFSKSYFKEFGLSYLDLDKSNYSWEFCFNRNKLQMNLGGDCFVPGIFFIKKKNSHLVETLCIWPEHIPFVLPKVDYILIQRTIKKLFKTKEERGLIAYPELISRLGKYFVDEVHYKIISPSASSKISNLFNNLPLIGSFDGYGEGISVDKIVNIKGE